MSKIERTTLAASNLKKKYYFKRKNGERKGRMCSKIKIIILIIKKIFVSAALSEGRTTGYEQKDETCPLATFHRFIRSVPAVIVMVTDEPLRDARFVVTAKRAVITSVVGCYSRKTKGLKR